MLHFAFTNYWSDSDAKFGVTGAEYNHTNEADDVVKTAVLQRE